MATTGTKATGRVERPLSPHLQIYGLTWTMAMSIVHRITGGALYVGTLFLAIWLVATASGPHAYAAVSWIYGSILGKLVMFGFTWALLHHMLGGIRHLIWDFGAGFEREARFQLAKLNLIGSVVLTVLVWIIYFIAR